MKFLPSLLALAIAILPCSVHGAPRTFPEENFQIEVPDGWESMPPPAARLPPGSRIVLQVKSPAGDRLLFLMVHDKPIQGGADIKAHLADVMIPHHAKGWKTSEFRDEKFNGIPFTFFTVRMVADQPPQFFQAHTFTTTGIYSLMCMLKGGDSSTDEQLLALVKSFRFLQPVTPVTRTTP